MTTKTLTVEEARADITPMIDVTFLLLIFFLAGTTFREAEGRLKALLPRDKGPRIPTTTPMSDVRITILWVDAQGNPTATTDPDGGRPVIMVRSGTSSWHCPDAGPAGTWMVQPEWPGLISYLSELRAAYERGGDPDDKFRVTIDARPHVPWQHVVSVLDACTAARIKDVSFAGQ